MLRELSWDKVYLPLILMISGIIRSFNLLNHYPLLPGHDPYLHMASAILSENYGKLLGMRPFWYSFSVAPHVLLRTLAHLNLNLIPCLIFLTLLSILSQTYLVYLIGRNEFHPAVGLLAGISISLSPLYIARSSIPMPETWAMPFFMLAILCQQKGKRFTAFLISLIVSLIHPLTYVFCISFLLLTESLRKDKTSLRLVCLYSISIAIALCLSREPLSLVKGGLNLPRIKDLLSMGPIAFPLGLLGLKDAIRRSKFVASWTISNAFVALAVHFLKSPLSSITIRAAFFLVPSLSICGGLFLFSLNRRLSVLIPFSALLMCLSILIFPSFVLLTPPSETFTMEEPLSIVRSSPRNTIVVLPSTSQDTLYKVISISQRLAIRVPWITNTPSSEFVREYGIRVINLSSNTKLSQDEFKDLLGNPQMVLILGGEFLFPEEVESQIKELGYNVVRIGGRSRFETMAKLARVLWAESEIAILCSADSWFLISRAIKVASDAKVPLLLFSDNLVTSYESEEKVLARSHVVGALRELRVKYIYPISLNKSLNYLKSLNFSIVNGIEGFKSTPLFLEGVIALSCPETPERFLSRVKRTMELNGLEKISKVYVYIDPEYGALNPNAAHLLTKVGGKIVWFDPRGPSALVELSWPING